MVILSDGDEEKIDISSDIKKQLDAANI